MLGLLSQIQGSPERTKTIIISTIEPLISLKKEKLGLLEWTDDVTLLSQNIDRLLSNDYDLILTELTPFEILNNIDPGKVLRLKDRFKYYF